MKDKRKVAIYLLTAISILSIFGIIVTDMKYALTSDGATVLLLAQRQLATKQLFPEDFHHTTGVFVLALNLLIAPIMKVCHNWILSRSIAVVIQTIIGFFGILLLWKDKTTQNITKGLMMIILLALPLSYEVFENLYIQASYFTTYIKIIYALAAIKLYYESEKKKTHFFLIILVTAVCTLGNMRNVLVYTIPMLGACLIIYLIENQWDLIKTVKERSFQAIILSTVLGTGAGLASYRILTRSVKSSMDSYAGITCAGYNNAGSQLVQTISNIFTVYGASGDGNLVTLATVVRCFGFLYAVIAVLVIPVYVLFQYKKITNIFHKILLAYAWISNFAVLYMSVFTTANVERYLLPVYFNCIILLILSLDFIKEKMPMHMSRIAGGLFLAFVLVVHARVWVSGVDSLRSTQNFMESYETLHDKVINILEDEGIKYGYAEYWTAYRLMCQTNGEIEVGAVVLENMSPYLWGTSETYYDMETHQGKSFLLLAPSNISSLAKNHMDVLQRYYASADKVYNVDKYMLLIYDENVLGMDSMEGDSTVFQPEDLRVSDTAAFASADEICLFSGGMQYGPYITLQPGTYKIEITGSNLKELSSKVTAKSGTVEIPIESEQSEDDRIEYKFSIDETYTEIEFVNQCTGDGMYSEIDSICVEREKEK